MGAEVLHADPIPFLCAWYRAAFAARDEPYCEGVQFDRVEPDPASPGPFPERLVVFSDDGATVEPLGTAEHSIRVGILAATKENPQDAIDIALMILALAPRLPAVEPGNPFTAFRGANGPYAVAENQPRARQYLGLTLATAGRAL